MLLLFFRITPHNLISFTVFHSFFYSFPPILFPPLSFFSLRFAFQTLLLIFLCTILFPTFIYLAFVLSLFFSILFIFYFNRKHIKNINKYVEKEYHRKSARPGLNPRAVDTSLTIRLNCRTFPPYGTRNTLQESIPDRRIGSRSVSRSGNSRQESIPDRGIGSRSVSRSGNSR